MALSSSFSTSEGRFFESAEDFRVERSSGIVEDVLTVASRTRFGATFFRRDFGFGGVAKFIEFLEALETVSLEAALSLLDAVRDRFGGDGCEGAVRSTADEDGTIEIPLISDEVDDVELALFGIGGGISGISLAFRAF